MSLSYDRFTDHARRAFARAEALARRYGKRVAVTHLLLTLLRGEENGTRDLLCQSGINLVSLRHRLASALGPGGEEESGPVTLAGETKRAVALAQVEADQEAYPHVSTAQLLVGVAAATGTEAGRLLHDAGASPDRLRAIIAERIDAWRSEENG